MGIDDFLIQLVKYCTFILYFPTLLPYFTSLLYFPTLLPYFIQRLLKLVEPKIDFAFCYYQGRAKTDHRISTGEEQDSFFKGIPENFIPSSTSLTGSENHLASFRFQNTFLLNVWNRNGDRWFSDPVGEVLPSNRVYGLIGFYDFNTYHQA